MSIQLKTLRSEIPGDVYAEYTVSNQKDRMILSQDLQLHVRRGQGAVVTMIFEDCSAPTPDEAIDRLADWMERLAKELKGRQSSEMSIPIWA
jgi:hypothetical protein